MERRLRICQHCDGEFPVASTGRPPKYCSSTCRKNAWHAERTREAVTVAVAKALAAERRGSIRGNETRPASDIRGNETPVAGQSVDAPSSGWGAPMWPAPSTGARRAEAVPLWEVPDDQEQPDA